MVGLSVILETTNQGDFRQVLSKASVAVNRNHKSFPQTPSFPSLHSCFLCNQILLPGKDIYMYKGDKGFCSVECRCRQIFMDEQEDSIMKETSSFWSSESGSSSSMAASRNSKSTRNRRRKGEFAY